MKVTKLDHCSPNVFFGPATDEEIRAAALIFVCPEKGDPLLVFGEHQLERIVQRNRAEKLMTLIIPVGNAAEMATLVDKISEMKRASNN